MTPARLTVGALLLAGLAAWVLLRGPLGGSEPAPGRAHPAIDEASRARLERVLRESREGEEAP